MYIFRAIGIHMHQTYVGSEEEILISSTTKVNNINDMVHDIFCNF